MKFLTIYFGLCATLNLVYDANAEVGFKQMHFKSIFAGAKDNESSYMPGYDEDCKKIYYGLLNSAVSLDYDLDFLSGTFSGTVHYMNTSVKLNKDVGGWIKHKIQENVYFASSFASDIPDALKPITITHVEGGVLKRTATRQRSFSVVFGLGDLPNALFAIKCYIIAGSPYEYYWEWNQ